MYSRTASIKTGVQISIIMRETATKLAACGNAAICSPIIYKNAHTTTTTTSDDDDDGDGDDDNTTLSDNRNSLEYLFA